MRSRLSCESARAMAPELALGIIPGEERAQLLAHVASCASCRRVVDNLAEAADAILLTAPEIEPPAGFESGVLAQVRTPDRPRKARLAIIAAAALLAAIAAVGGTLWATAADRDLASHYRAALAEANGEYFGVKPLRDRGTKVGNLFAYQGDPSWIFIVLDEDAGGERYSAEVRTKDGDEISLGSFELPETRRTWGTHLDIDLREVAMVRLIEEDGSSLEARFPPP